jgi:DNA-binding transcriptional LysR family regulator
MNAPLSANLSRRDLAAFLALAEQRNFTRAAAACHLSQPAFSTLIRGLERQLGVRLFDRSTRHVALTAEGEDFERSARRVLEEIERALAGVREQVARARGRASVALLPSLAAGWLPQLLAAFRARYPGIDVEVADALSEPCIERVRRGEADFALAATRGQSPELKTEPFCADEFHLICRRDHALARLRRPRPRDVAEHPFIHLSRTSSVRQYIDAATHPATLAPLLEVEQLATVAGLVKAGLGVTIVPALALYQFGDAELVRRPLAWQGLKRQIYLVRRRDRPLSLAAEALYAAVLKGRPR